MYRSLINFRKTKYEVLQKLFANSLDGVTELNCFVSLDTVLKSLYGYKPDEISESLAHAHSNSLSSEIINFAAHYRHYFWSRYGIPSNYFFYYSSGYAEYCCEINPAYREDYYNKHRGVNTVKEYAYINETVEKNIEFVKIISAYLPNIYFLDSGRIEPAVLPQLLIQKNPADEHTRNLILTTYKNEYQLVNNKYTYILTLNGDDSRLYDKHGIIGTLYKSTDSVETVRTIRTHFSSKLYVAALAISGYPKYNITGTKGYSMLGVCKKLSSLLASNTIANVEYASLDEIAPYFPKADLQLINNNYNILNLKYQAKIINNIDYIRIKEQLVNKSDNMSLMNLNDKYYADNPLMLIELMEGEE